MDSSTNRRGVSPVESNSDEDEPRCLSCGKALPNRRQRYCSKKCRDQLENALKDFGTQLLPRLQIEFATFRFADEQLVLNVVPGQSGEVHSFFFRRTPGLEPARDLRRMYVQMVEQWQAAKRATGSDFDAGQKLLSQAMKGVVALDDVKPQRVRPSAEILKCLAGLGIQPDTPVRDLTETYLNKAFRKAAPEVHADTGGSDEAFKKLKEQREILLRWVKSPESVGGRWGLPGRWLYDANKKKWVPPL